MNKMPTMNKMPFVKVTTQCGHTWSTCMAIGITENEARKYFVDKIFNLGDVEGPDILVRVSNIEYFPPNNTEHPS